MNALRTLFVCALASLAGCGGCDACSSRPAGETQPTATTQVGASDSVEDAARALSPEAAAAGADAGRNDAAATAATTVVPLAVSAPARPRGAPMPIGDFQSCGVYDGPLCTKLCPKGNCRQECDGVDCVLSCSGGYCAQLCGASATCRLTCPGGHCIQVCSASGCTRECAGGSCE
jgi:hypothetical protein